MQEVRLEQLVQTQPDGFRKRLATTLLPPITALLSGIGARSRDSVVITGIEHLTEDSGYSPHDPALWLLGHEAWADFVHYPAIWSQLPGTPPMNGVSRSNYFPQIPPLSWAVSILMRSTLFVEVDRVSLMNGVSEQKKERARLRNQRQLERLRESYHRGLHIAIAPEGTTKRDGRVGPIKAGAYNLSHVTLSNGNIGVVPCIPIGNTYDYLTAGKPIVFFSFGKPFFYQPETPAEGESKTDYQKRDIAAFSARVEMELLGLTTITTTQLVGHYLLNLAQRHGPLNVTHEELERVVASAVGSLPAEVLVDPALKVYGGIGSRISALYLTLQQRGYLTAEGALCRDTILQEPSQVEEYKHPERGNILRYCVNRLLQVAEQNPEVAAAIRAS